MAVFFELFIGYLASFREVTYLRSRLGTMSSWRPRRDSRRSSQDLPRPRERLSHTQQNRRHPPLLNSSRPTPFVRTAPHSALWNSPTQCRRGVGLLPPRARSVSTEGSDRARFRVRRSARAQRLRFFRFFCSSGGTRRTVQGVGLVGTGGKGEGAGAAGVGGAGFAAREFPVNDANGRFDETKP